MRIENFDWRKFKRIFIAIDAANLEHSAKDLKKYVRYQQLLNFFKEKDINLLLNQLK